MRWNPASKGCQRHSGPPAVPSPALQAAKPIPVGWVENFGERQKVNVCHFSGNADSTQAEISGAQQDVWRLDWERGRRQEVGRQMWEPAKVGFGLDKLLFSWLAWIVTYYSWKWKEDLKTEASVTTPTFLSAGSRHKAASAQPYDGSVGRESHGAHLESHRCWCTCGSIAQPCTALE